MVYKYKLQPEAERDLEGIWRYTAEQWGVDQAVKYIDALDDAFKHLAQMPLICRERQEFRPPVRIYQHERHLIVYIVSNDEMIIIRILHAHMNLEDHLLQA